MAGGPLLRERRKGATFRHGLAILTAGGSYSCPQRGSGELENLTSIIGASAVVTTVMTHHQHPTGLSRMRLTTPDAVYSIVAGVRAMAEVLALMALYNLTILWLCSTLILNLYRLVSPSILFA